MRMRPWLGLLISLTAGPAAAQEQPDFTGQWVLETPVAADIDAARELSVRQWFEHATSVRDVPIDIPHVTIERHFPSGLRSESYQIGISGGMTGGLAAGGSVPSWSTRYACQVGRRQTHDRDWPILGTDA